MGLFAPLTLAAHAVDNLIAALHDRPLTPLEFAYYGQGTTLGSRDALGLLTYPDDRPRGPIFRGRLAYSIREFAVWLVAFLLEIERRWPGSYFWLKGPHAMAKPAPAQPGATSLKEKLEHR